MIISDNCMEAVNATKFFWNKHMISPHGPLWLPEALDSLWAKAGRALPTLGEFWSLPGWLADSFLIGPESVDIKEESTTIPFGGGGGQENYFAF